MTPIEYRTPMTPIEYRDSLLNTLTDEQRKAASNIIFVSGTHDGERFAGDNDIDDFSKHYVRGVVCFYTDTARVELRANKVETIFTALLPKTKVN